MGLLVVAGQSLGDIVGHLALSEPAGPHVEPLPPGCGVKILKQGYPQLLGGFLPESEHSTQGLGRTHLPRSHRVPGPQQGVDPLGDHIEKQHSPTGETLEHSKQGDRLVGGGEVLTGPGRGLGSGVVGSPDRDLASSDALLGPAFGEGAGSGNGLGVPGVAHVQTLDHGPVVDSDTGIGPGSDRGLAQGIDHRPISVTTEVSGFKVGEDSPAGLGGDGVGDRPPSGEGGGSVLIEQRLRQPLRLHRHPIDHGPRSYRRIRARSWGWGSTE